MSIRSSLTAVVAAAALIALPMTGAYAASGSSADRTGDGYPDIVRLTFANKAKAVQMSMTYVDLREAQAESFYLRWKAGKSYQAFIDTSGIRQLRYYSSASATGQVVACAGLRFTHRAAKDRTRVTIPRSCLPKAPNALRFQGLATMGTSFIDKSATSPKIARG